MSVVIIPAYQPDETLAVLADRLWGYGCQIIVVDDGSGNAYQSLFDSLKDKCVVLRHSENRGKGAAIKTALNFIAQEFWEEQMIGIMDADGQHLPKDMMRLLKFAECHKGSLVLGVREVGADMPFKSRIGNAVTRKIFHLVTGLNISDTQTGLRVFSSDLLEKMCTVKGERYEYEMNVLMAMAKSGIPIKEVPIQTIYRDEHNSTSHFHAFRDSIRIYKDLLKFTLASFSSFVLDYLLFNIMVLLLPGEEVSVVLANVAARIISACYNYTMNCRFVFHTEKELRTAEDYFVLAVCILLVNNLILESFLVVFHLPVWTAKLMTECLLFIMSWLVQHKIIFKKEQILKTKEVKSWEEN